MNGHDLKLGELLPNTWQPRDAVHIAVIPVEAGEQLSPGAHVRLTEHGVAVEAEFSADSIGVVSPFLVRNVEPGQCFWLLLHPGTITSLRHEWSHPSWPSSTSANAEQKAESEAWLSEFIGTWWVGRDYSKERVPMYKEVITNILNGKGGSLYGREAHDVPDEFWFHLERLIGREISRSTRENTYFDCWC